MFNWLVMDEYHWGYSHRWVDYQLLADPHTVISHTVHPATPNIVLNAVNPDLCMMYDLDTTIVNFTSPHAGTQEVEILSPCYETSTRIAAYRDALLAAKSAT